VTDAPRFVLTRSSGRSSPPPPPVRPAAAKQGACATPSQRPPAPSFPDVWVDDVEIEAEAIARELQHHPAADPVEAWTAAARALVVRELLLRRARQLGVTADGDPDVDAGEAPEEALVRRLLDRELAPAKPDETECRRYYEGQRERFRTPELFEAAHILIEQGTDDAAGWAAAEAQARRLADQIGQSRSAFVQAARTHSTCPSAQQDGSLGQVRRGELAPPVQAALEATPAGTNLAEPVRSRFGWHLLRLERRIEGRDLPYEVVKDRIRDTLEARAWAVAAGTYVSSLASAARIKGVELAAPTESPCASC
jgi:peptidyl-prolyl cis-trans isomerase C